MSSEEVLKASEEAALERGQIVSHVVGKKHVKGEKKKKKASAAVFLTAMLLVFLAFFSTGNMVPAAISERLIEETDMQYADAVESKMLVFQQALLAGEIPDDTAQLLKENNVLVGVGTAENFTEKNKGGESLSLFYNGQVVPAKDFIRVAHEDAALYGAFNNATYARAAYYYDESAKKVFRQVGTNRNNYTNEEDEFADVMDKVLGSGSSININTVGKVEKEDKEGNKYYVDEKLGGDAASKDAGALVSAVGQKNKASDATTATMNAADELSTADMMSEKQRSMLFFVTFMENISKMKAGEGNDSKITDAMNYLYESRDSEVVDTATGEVVTVKGSMLESPSLYALLAGEPVKMDEVDNYSSERILKTVEGRAGVENASGETLGGTVASAGTKKQGTIGRYIYSGQAGADAGQLDVVRHTVDKSLVNNGFETIGGVSGGEMLVSGAVNLGAELAKIGGGTVGDEAAAKSYARLNTTVLALDAKVDRMNRSPLDTTSKNTFLGSIVYNMAISFRGGSMLMRSVGSMLRTVGTAVGGLLPVSFADDGTERYLGSFGDCEKVGSIGGTGSASCADSATFDTSTLNDTFNDAGFVAFVENNTELVNGVRRVKNGSKLADFLAYNARMTPAGVMDGGILDAVVNGNSGSIPVLSDIFKMVKTLLGASEAEKRIANGAAFVNSSSNADWETYKYAQRYVSLARATENLQAHAKDKTAYQKIQYFEGEMNPVIAFLNQYYADNVVSWRSW